MSIKKVVKAAGKLAKTGRYFHSRGWSLATSSNYSYRVDKDKILITSSGCAKEDLAPQDFMLVDMEGKAIESSETRRPSAETLLHCAVYSAYKDAKCVLHTHSVFASVLSKVYQSQGYVELHNYEMMKALSGIITHETLKKIPVYKNSQTMSDIVTSFMQDVAGTDQLHAYLIAGHGMYTWAPGIPDARRQVEALEFLFECTYRETILSGILKNE